MSAYQHKAYTVVPEYSAKEIAKFKKFMLLEGV
jgi:hypothetical protein